MDKGLASEQKTQNPRRKWDMPHKLRDFFAESRLKVYCVLSGLLLCLLTGLYFSSPFWRPCAEKVGSSVRLQKTPEVVQLGAAYAAGTDGQGSVHKPSMPQFSDPTTLPKQSALSAQAHSATPAPATPLDHPPLPPVRVQTENKSEGAITEVTRAPMPESSPAVTQSRTPQPAQAVQVLPDIKKKQLQPKKSTKNPSQKTGKKIRLFGTVEFKGPLKNLPAWLAVLSRNSKRTIFFESSKLNSRTTWGAFKAQADALTPLEQLRLVNRFWNQWPYREDRDVYGKDDYWAIPEEFRKNSGDCEDYSIVKYFTLRALGFPVAQLRIVVLMETIRNQAHAVLVVFLDNDAYVLDNLNAGVLSHTRYPNYEPQFSVNEQFRWAHVRPR